MANKLNLTWIMVSSADGKITRHQEKNIYDWTSQEDQDYFFGQIKQNNVIIMGSTTYERSRPVIKLQEGKLRVVLTSRPEQYKDQAIPGQLEFWSDEPAVVAEKLAAKGFTRGLLVGGSQIADAFLKAELISKLILTIEPRLFGIGTPLLTGAPVDIKLKLQEITQLNDQGTLLLKYDIISE